jgi:carboxylesterase type B
MRMTRVRRTLFAATLCAFALVLAPGSAQPSVPSVACSTEPIRFSSGQVCGITVPVADQRVSAYLGIPFAETTAGGNRWKPPVPKAAWSGVVPATTYGQICPQNQQLEGSPDQSEDCLSINVWTPTANPTAKRPVLVFIHGGAFVIGSSTDVLRGRPIYDGSYLASQHDIVVVNMNYRLGALGFLGGVAGLKGNFGFMDQQLALEWVRDNIAAFGGDPTRVTISGESAGAMSVGLHLLSAPKSAPLFRAAIMQSNPLGLPYKNLSEAQRIGEMYLVASGCWFKLNPLNCLRGKSTAELLKAQTSPLLLVPTLEFGLYSLVTWAPVVDGEVITAAPLTALANGGLTKPILIGTNAEEATPFLAGGRNPIKALGYQTALTTLFGSQNSSQVLTAYPFSANGDNRRQLTDVANDYFFACPTRFLARASKAPVYLYEYTHGPSVSLWPEVPACNGKACHGDELPFAFNTINETAYTSDERRLAQNMTAYWGRFVKAQNPNADGSGVNWPAFAPDQQRLEIDTALSVGLPSDRQCGFWDGFGYGRIGFRRQ